MLERTRRPMTEEDRRVLEQYRQRELPPASREAKYAFLGGAAGAVLGFLWLTVFHWGDGAAALWPVLALAAAGAGLGLPFDRAAANRRRAERAAAAAARWDPILAVGEVERIVASVSDAVRIDDDEGDTAWFLQVEDDAIVCVWAWTDDATERVEVDLVPGSAPTGLAITWTGAELAPLRPTRLFRRGEHLPEQCEVLRGRLEDLDAILREEGRKRRSSAPRPRPATPASKLADDVEALGFYKYVDGWAIDEVKAEIGGGAYAWYRAAGRAFGADAERLAEGGVSQLLAVMRPALSLEGWDVGEVTTSYDPDRGYTLRVGGDEHSMWHPSERKTGWALTLERAAALINAELARAASEERVHVLGRGEDTVFVLLTPALREAIARSGVFEAADVPSA